MIQCKFTSKRDSNLRAADLADEIKKAANVGKRGLCDTYLLMTNAGVSGAAAAEITAALKGNGVKHAAIFGSTWICDQIQEHKRLRMMVPRIYGLGDLSQILDDRAYRQARALLASLRDDLSKVVITAAYRRAAEALVSKKYLDNQRSRRFFKDSFRKRAMDRRQRAPDFIETDVIVRGVRPLVGRNQ